eukprot:gene6486-9360_t
MSRHSPRCQQDGFHLERQTAVPSTRDFPMENEDIPSRKLQRPPIPIPDEISSFDNMNADYNTRENKNNKEENVVDDPFHGIKYITRNNSNEPKIGGRSEEDAAKGILYLPWSRPPIARHK